MISVESTPFGSADGKDVTLFTLKNESGMGVAIMNYGAIIQSIRVPDRNGIIDDIVLGFDTLDEYVTGNDPYFGAICGRVANRISKGRFTLEGVDYSLAINNGPNALHGGIKGFDKRVWSAETAANGVCLRLSSDDGEEGYPGNLDVSVLYTLTDDNVLVLEYSAATDRTTIVNLTNHSYFNLGGHGAGTVFDHEITIKASHYTPVDDDLIPSGGIAPVTGTPLDFLSAHRIGERIEAAGGYDHNFALDAGTEGPAVLVSEPATGRTLEMETTEPGVQFYTGNFLEDNRGKNGATYPMQGGFCLEAQHFPDSINQPSFLSTILRPEDTYSQRTLYRFGILV